MTDPLLIIDELRAALQQEHAARLDVEERMRDKTSELSHIHQQIIQLNQQLEQRIQAQTSEVKKYNEQLLITSNRLALLVQNLQYGLVLVDENRKVFLANRVICELFNIPQQPGQLLGWDCNQLTRQIKDFFPNPEAFVARIEFILDEKALVMNEQLPLLNGRIIQRDYIPILNNGQYYGHLWVYNDITEQVMADKRLFEQRQFYEDVLNKIPADVVVFNVNKEYVFVNPQAIADVTLREWIIGKTDDDYCRLRNRPMDMAEKRKRLIEEVIATRQLKKWEERFVLPDGTVKYHLRHIMPVTDDDGNVKWLIGYGLDITDGKRIEEQIQHSEKRYRDLFDFSLALICTHDLTGRLLTVNPALSQAMESTAAEMVGRSIADFLTTEDYPLFDTNYLQPILQQGKSEGVFRVVSKNGKRIFLWYQNYKMEEPDGESYIISFSTDITLRMKAERELKQAKQLADASAHAKEVFLANMSHEIRTPMNGVLGIAGLLAKTKLNDQQQNYLRLIQESANNLLRIVNDVLDLEKIINGKLQTEQVFFAVRERVEMCLQAFTFKAEEKGIALYYRNTVPEEVAVLGDPYRLSQVLNNLISNAMKFTEQGAVTIETRMAHKEEKQVWIEFSVTDTGVGIPENMLSKVFEPFMQANSSISRKYGGTGLGLSICRELIQLMGGDLLVTSEVDKGSRFYFTLPFEVSLLNVTHPVMEKERNYQKLSNRKILLAEDVELNQYLARHIMESWGLEVDIANNGAEAVAMLVKKEYDLVLMDIQMPEMDGMEATRQIRLLPDAHKASIPIVALTANALKGDSEKYIAVGMNDYLSKPFDESKLFQIISNNLKNEMINGMSTLSETTTPSLNPAEKLYDLSMVRSIAGGDEGFIKRMVQLFIDTMPPAIAELQQMAARNEWDALGKQAHKMKATIDSMGISLLHADIRTLEMNGKKAAATEAIPALVNNVKQILEACIQQLKNDYAL